MPAVMLSAMRAQFLAVHTEVQHTAMGVTDTGHGFEVEASLALVRQGYAMKPARSRNDHDVGAGPLRRNHV